MSPPRAPFAARIALLPPPGEADRHTLALTLWGEARGEGVVGMAAVAAVIVNRMLASARLIERGRQAAWWGGAGCCLGLSGTLAIFLLESGGPQSGETPVPRP